MAGDGIYIEGLRGTPVMRSIPKWFRIICKTPKQKSKSEPKVLDHLCSKLRTKSISKLVFPSSFLSVDTVLLCGIL